MNQSQLESKLWIINELIGVMTNKVRCLLGGWYAQFYGSSLMEYGASYI